MDLKSELASGFEKTGIIPFDPEKVRSIAFKPAVVEHVPLTPRKQQFIKNTQQFVAASQALGMFNDFQAANLIGAIPKILQRKLFDCPSN